MMVIFILCSLLASAQESTNVISQLEVSLWPEYDDPRLLVIYRGTLAENAKGPLAFLLPDTAQVHAVAHRDADDRLLADEWQVLPGESGQQLLTFTAGSRQFQFEYYQDITRVGSQRSFVFRFLSSRYEVTEFTIEVQQPLRSSNFQAIPELEAQGRDTQGLAYFKKKVGTVSANTPIEQTISYLKLDNAPSVKPQTTGDGSSNFLWQIAGGVVALAVSLAGLTWLWLLRRRKPPTPKASARQRGSAQTATVPDRTKAAFCANCGHRFLPEERFCPGCGRARP
jgi:hypothetical protein